MIKTIDYDKYIVIKQDDVNKYLLDSNKCELKNILNEIKLGRLKENKERNKYIVFNASDKIDLTCLIKRLLALNQKYKLYGIKTIALLTLKSISNSHKVKL